MVVVDKAFAKKWHASYLPGKKAKYFLETHPSQLDNFNIGDQVQI
jgi:hypothetical protein